MKLLKRHNHTTMPIQSLSPTLAPPDPSLLPIDARTGQPMPPVAQPGYYPGYHTLDQQAFWDEATRNVVLDRVYNVPPIRFFSPREARLMQAICARILPQDDRDEEHKIPIVNVIDKRLATKHIHGYRYEDMPPDRDAYRLGLKGIEAVALCLYTRAFIELQPREQDHVLLTIHDGEPPAGAEIWQQMSIKRFWMLLAQDVIEAYYAHPYAWDEIGFGGPAYPRGYMRLLFGDPEPWEVDEQRYAWQTPPSALSDVYNYPDMSVGHKSQAQRQKGTH